MVLFVAKLAPMPDGRDKISIHSHRDLIHNTLDSIISDFPIFSSDLTEMTLTNFYSSNIKEFTRPLGSSNTKEFNRTLGFGYLIK